MNTSTQIEDYLERLIQFKQSKDLDVEYIEPERLEKLLKELTFGLGFEKHIWQERKNQAAYYYFIYDQIQDDSNLGSQNNRAYIQLCLHYLKKAINLDPFNAEYLSVYVKNHGYKWTPELFRKIQFLQLIKPASTEATAQQVELGVRPDEMHFDYFTDEVIGPYVNELVFFQEWIIHEKEFESDEKLKDLAEQAGIDSETLTEVKDELNEMYKLVDKTNDDYWLDWKKIHTAYLTADKMTDLAPFQPQILEAGIKFYGSTLWRAILDASPSRISKTSDGYIDFCASIYGSGKPKLEHKLKVAQESIEKAQELARRYDALPDSFFVEKTSQERFMESLQRYSLASAFRSLKSPVQVKAFVKAQSIMHRYYDRLFKFKQQNFRFGVVMVVVMYLVAALFCQLVLGSVNYLWTVIVLPGFMGGGIAHLRSVWWKRYRIQFDPE